MQKKRMNFFLNAFLSNTLGFSSSRSTRNAIQEGKSSVDESIKQNKLLKKKVHFPFDFDRWYPPLSQHTFDSVIIPISPETVQAMIELYRQTFHHPLNCVFTKKHAEELRGLENRLQDIINTQFATTPFFVRMSNRSPKDGIPFASIATPTTFMDRTKSITDDSALSDNDRMIALCELQMQDLQCTTVQDCLQLLLTSERVFADLLLAMDCAEIDPLHDEWSTSIILRTWEPALRQQDEFRLFICQRQLTAVSQYNPYCCYGQLVHCVLQQPAHTTAFLQSLQTFVQQTSPCIQHDDYVLDVAVLQFDDFLTALLSDDDHVAQKTLLLQRMKVIELNPFDTTTGGGLFFWQSDGEILRGEKRLTAGAEDETGLPVLRIRKTVDEDHIHNWVEMMVHEQEMLTMGAMKQSPYSHYLEQAINMS